MKTRTLTYHTQILLLICIAFESKSQVTIQTIDSTTLYSYQWYLFQMPDVNMYEVDNSRIPNLLFSPDSQFYGEAICNYFEGHLKLSGRNNIQFIDIKEEVFNCPNDVDPKFMAMLRNVFYYKIQNNLLKLFDKDGILLAKFWAEFTHQSHHVMTALDGNWIQNSLKKPKGWHNLKLLDTLPQITFSKNVPGFVSGFTGCNSFTGTYTLNKSKINFTSIRTLQDKPCKSEVEENFKNYLSVVTMFWVSDDLLLFWEGNSLVMDFLRVEDLKLRSGPVWRFLEKKRKRTIYGCSFGNDDVEE